jgi:hypothetical protein
MADTRRALSEKVATLEDVLRSSIRDTSDAVRDRVRTVASAAEGAADKVAGHVRSALDVSGHVRANPWAMVAGSFAAGFLAGCAPRRLVPAQVEVPRPSTPHAVSAVRGTADRFLDKAETFLQRIVDEIGESVVGVVRNVAANLQRDVPNRVTGLLNRLAEPADHATHPIGRWNGSGGESI